MKPLKPLKEKISITIDADILEKIKYEAECDDRSLSQYIILCLKIISIQKIGKIKNQGYKSLVFFVM